MQRITGNTYPVKEQLKALGGRWDAAAKCWLVPDDKAEEARRLVGGPTPIYNSPPPQDLGTADPIALAAEHERTAVAGARVVSFRGYGKTPTPNGTIHRVRGKRYAQVAHGRPRYFSRDMLEDFDMFDDQPGYQYQWDGVEVEPTPEEAAEDAAKAEAKAAAEAQKRAEAEAKAAAEVEAIARFQAAVAGLVRCTVGPASYKETGERITGLRNTVAAQVTLEDGRTAWREDWQGGDDWRTYWHLPPDAVREITIGWAAKTGVTRDSARTWLEKYSGCHGAEEQRIIAGLDDAAAADLAAMVEANRQAKIEKRQTEESRSLETWARQKLAELGLLEPTDDYGRKHWARQTHPMTPDMLVSWEFRPGRNLRDYVEAREAYRDCPQIEGTEIVLRLAPAAFERKPRSRKPAPVDAVPAQVTLHHYCVATVTLEKSEPCN